MNFQIAAISKKGSKKTAEESNGDDYNYYTSFGKGSNKIVTIFVTDGLSIEDASKKLTDFGTIISASNNMASSDSATIVVETNPFTDVNTDANGFCSVTWDFSKNEAVAFALGSVHIYKHTIADGLIQMKTNCSIGETKFCFYSIGFLPGESLIVCSDGMYNSSSFKQDVVSLLNEVDLETSIRKVVTTDDDDMSIVVVRRDFIDTTNINILELMEHFKEYRARIPAAVLAEKICDELDSMLSSDLDIEKLGEMASLMKGHQIYPEKERIDSVLTKAVKRLKTMPEGKQKQRFNEVCWELKDVLRYVFTH